MQEPQLLHQILMFVSYYAYEIKCNVRSIPGIMSGLWHGMVERLVTCCAVFDDELLKTVKQGVSKLPAPAHRTCVLCTLEMINQSHHNNEYIGNLINMESSIPLCRRRIKAQRWYNAFHCKQQLTSFSVSSIQSSQV